MVLLLFNYAMFNNHTLLIFGWVIAALEAATAVLQFIRTVFKNNKRIADKIDKAISKCEKTLTVLRQKQSDYRTILACEAVERGELLYDNPEHVPAQKEVEEPQPPDVVAMPAEGIEEIESEKPERAGISLDSESAELLAKFVGSLHKND